MEPKPWERLEKEPELAFRQFLIYLALGPERTILKAFQVYCESINGAEMEAVEVSDEFRRTAKRFKWEERAGAFNAHAFMTKGLTATFGFIGLIDSMTRKLQEAIETRFDELSKKATIPQIMEAIDVLSKFIPQQTVQRVLDQSAVTGPQLRIANEPEVRDQPGALCQGSAADSLPPSEDRGSVHKAGEAS